MGFENITTIANKTTTFFCEGVGCSSLLVIGLISLLLYVYIRNYNLPPGPIGLPYIGYYPFFGKEVEKQLAQLAKKYGDVFSFTVTGQLFIHLNTIKFIKEAHINQTDVFSGRPNTFNIFKQIDDGNGIVFTNGQKWKEVRRFLIHSLKQFGLGRNTLQIHIHEAVRRTVDALKDTKGEPYDAIKMLTDNATYVLAHLVFRGDSEHYEQQLKRMHKSMNRLIEVIIGPRSFLTGSFFRYFMFPLMPAYKVSNEIRAEITSAIQSIVDEHERTLDKDNIRDFIDMYLDERRKLKEKGSEKAEYFTLELLKASLIEIFIDGTDSIGIAVYHFFRLLIEHPEVQERIQKEVDEVVGRERLPAIEDKTNLPYTEATILEFYRNSYIFPFVTSLESSRETTINGYRIPKGAITVPNIWSAHRDPSVYPNPEKFDPGRFLGPDGKRTKTDLPIVFGVGKRSCVGESLVNMELFLFVTAILQHFTIRRPPGVKELSSSSFDEILQYEMCAIPRSSS